MKECIYCGKKYPDEVSVCAIDGYALRKVIDAPPAQFPVSVSERQQIVDDEHLNLLSIFHFVVAGLALLGMGFLVVHFLLMSTFFSNPNLWKLPKDATGPPKELFQVFIWLYLFLGCVLVTASVLNLMSGLFLRQRRHRIFSIVVGGLNCLHIPFGTALGVFTMIVLSRGSVRQRYND